MSRKLKNVIRREGNLIKFYQKKIYTQKKWVLSMAKIIEQKAGLTKIYLQSHLMCQAL